MTDTCGRAARRSLIGLLLLAALLSSLAPARLAQALSPDVVISQVYGGGGNTGATLRNDFIELFNRGAQTVSLAGWSVQYSSSTGIYWQVTNLTGSIAPGGYYLVQQAQGAGGSVDLPPPDATGTTPLNATEGKVALVSSTTALFDRGCPFQSTVIDFVGYGAPARCAEGAGPTPGPSSTTAVLRAGNGCTETDNNSADFAAGPPNPRNSAAAAAPCGAVLPTVTLAVSASSASEAAQTVVTVTATASAVVSGAQTVSLAVSGAGITTGDYTLSNSTITIADGQASGSVSFTVVDDTASEGAETATLTIGSPSAGIALGAPLSQAVTIADNEAAPAPCTAAATAIGAVQGSGDSSPAAGSTVTVQGVVVGDYELPSGSGQIRGFYLQDSGDGDPATSDGIFVFTGGTSRADLGRVVQVTGAVSEFEGQTQLGGTLDIEDCGASESIPSVAISLPLASADALERYEGMLVRFPQTLFVSEHFQLGRFGQVTLSSGGRLAQPSNVVAPGTAANALQAANNLNRIILDDDNNSQNVDPIIYGRDGQPLSASNTLRGGDSVAGLTGVLTYGWAGNSASGNAYRVRAVGDLDPASPSFQPANPRPAAAPAVGGALRIVALNVLNYFLTLDRTSGSGPCGPSATLECRGANSATEQTRQRDKLLQALLGLNADVIGLIELENTTGVDPVGDLVSGLNALTAPGTYAGLSTGTIGTDAIKVGLIYRPGKVAPVGQPQIDTSTVYSRPPLAQRFAQAGSGEQFTVVVNHFKSKGSCPAAGDPNADQGDGQSCWNALRVEQARALLRFIKTTLAPDDPDVLILGDLNSYAREDPIRTILAGPDGAAGTADDYSNLILQHAGADAYSYAFDGQWGYLDHALASPGLAAQVAGAAEWHINADEPGVLDYNTEFKSVVQIASLYSADPFRISDHDPVVVGLRLGQPNNAPTIGGDTVTTSRGRAVSIPATQLLANDADPEGDTNLSITAVSGAIHGTVSLASDVITFTPAPGFAGQAGFSYTVSDSAGAKATAGVTVEVLARSSTFLPLVAR